MCIRSARGDLERGTVMTESMKRAISFKGLGLEGLKEYRMGGHLGSVALIAPVGWRVKRYQNELAQRIASIRLFCSALHYDEAS